MQFTCERCEKSEETRKNRACYPDYKRRTPEKVTVAGKTIDCWYCKRSISQAVSHWFPHYSRLRDSGVLPRPGGWDDQPANYCQAMDIIGAVESSRMQDLTEGK